MQSSRRKFLLFTLISIAWPKNVFASRKLSDHNISPSILFYIELFLPGDEKDIIESRVNIMKEFERYMRDEAFKNGMKSGITALGHYRPAINTPEQAHRLLNTNTPEGHFLSALLDITLESFYGQKFGWEDLAVSHPLT